MECPPFLVGKTHPSPLLLLQICLPCRPLLLHHCWLFHSNLGVVNRQRSRMTTSQPCRFRPYLPRALFRKIQNSSRILPIPSIISRFAQSRQKCESCTDANLRYRHSEAHPANEGRHRENP